MEASVIIPVRDEFANIGPICEAFQKFMQTNTCVREVIFVDDGSQDGTLDQLKTYSTQFRFVKYLTHSEPSGKGAAIRTGFQKSLGEILILMDGDQQYTPRDIPRLLHPIVSGSADLSVGHGTNGHSSIFRQLFSKTYQGIFVRMFGLQVSCPNEGFKAIVKSKFDELEVTANGFEFDIDLLVKAKRRNHRIAEIAIERLPRSSGKSKVRIIPTAARFFARMAKLWFSQEKLL